MVGLKFFLPLLLGSAEVALSLPVDSDSNALTLIDCLGAANVPMIPPSSTEYAAEVLAYNLRLEFYPTVVAVPTTSAHVSSAVKCAGQFKTKVAARSGGHSYAAYGLGGTNGSLMIDTKKFRELTLDPATNVAKVGAGLRLGDVASGLYNQGRRALPHGTCPGVGISGHALHGGFGYASRMWGTTLDNIVEMEVVRANGDIVTVSKSSDPDLFWALRGAGSSFGIVTTFSLTTYPAPENSVSFSWSWSLEGNSADVVDTKVKVFEALQEYSVNLAPSNMAIQIYMEPGVYSLSGLLWGSRADYDTAIAPLVEAFPQDGLPTPEITERGYLETMVFLAQGAPLPQPEDYDKHDTFFAKSIVTSTKFTTKALTSFFSFDSPDSNRAPLSWFVLFDLYGGKYSNLSAREKDSSYSIRDALFTVQLYSYESNPTVPPTPYPSWGFDFLKQMSESMTLAQPETEFQAYANYVDPTLSPAEAHSLYYGSNYPRLESLKKVYDPDSLIWNPQAIGTS